MVTISAAAQAPPQPDEIPIERCDRLPVVKVRIDGADLRFLLDTGATTLLNLKSFTGGHSKKVEVSSWSGTASTSAREVRISELALGRYRLRDLKLPAIDLSPIAEACGGRIDGILGVDLLEKMGATIDLERRVARLGRSAAATADEKKAAHDHSAMQQDCLVAFNAGDRAALERCLDRSAATPDEKTAAHDHSRMLQDCLVAFNASNLAALERCLDPEVVLFTTAGEYRGRKAMLEYVQQRFFFTQPRPRMEMHIKTMHLLGPAAWYDYDYSIQLPNGRIEGRGTGVCRKSGDRWLLLAMHNSHIQPEAEPRP